MKKSICYPIMLMLLSVLASGNVLAAAQRYTLDASHTTVAFLIEHVGYARTLGFFSQVSGGFAYDEATGQVSELEVTIQTDSVQSDNKARDKHVRSKDFLNTGKYPSMTFSADSAVVADGGTLELEGQLTLLGQTRPLTLSVTLNKAEKYPFGHKLFTLGVSARGELQRSDYGMDYGVANAIVGDTVELIIESEANQQ